MVGAASGRINLPQLYSHIGDDLRDCASELMATCADRSSDLARSVSRCVVGIHGYLRMAILHMGYGYRTRMGRVWAYFYTMGNTHTLLMTHKYRGFIVVLSINKSVEPNEEQKVLMSGFDQRFTVNTSKQVFRGNWQYE
jgi:hypothetical protein